MPQSKLPLNLKCCNPSCNNGTYQQHFFCSDSCYEVVRISSLSQSQVIPMTPENQSTGAR
jgi:hypothetical protein